MPSKKKNSNFRINLEELSNKIIIQFSGDFIYSNSRIINDYELINKFEKFSNIIFDFQSIEAYDSFLVTYINLIKKQLKDSTKTIELQGMNPGLESFYNYLTKLSQDTQRAALPRTGLFFRYIEKLGLRVRKIIKDGYLFVSFLGEIIVGFLKTFFTPSRVRWEDVPNQIIRIGVSAVPISLLIVFLIGLVTGYQGALQLKIFGADIYIADLISVSLTRELAPLMVAIIVAGRSGSAFTAEIGTMKLSEEIDALKVMGFNSTDFIVMPRLIASMISVPIIVMLADLSGILGGLTATLTTLDLTPAAYFNRMQEALYMSDIFSGLIKAEIFGFFIALIGCFRGMQVSGGSESVGHYTTSSVVTSIFHIVIIDSIFTIIFPMLGI
jgi:phospholipid/cholesterol/gamma-HCH transport system permease protein